MKKIITIVTCTGLLLTAPAYAEGLNNMINNPNESTAPISAAPSVPPNEPDHDYGSSSSTYKLPSDYSPTSGSTSQPSYQLQPKKKPAAADNNNDE